MQKQRSSVRNRPKCVNGVSNGSMLLVDYRMDRYPNLQLSDIISHVYEFATDYKGSKFVQRKLDEATGARKDAIFREMRPQLLNLMMNTFGNFIVQKFFDVGSVEHRNEITKLVREHFMELSLDKYGCRVVQTVIEKAPPNLQPYIFHSHEDRDIVLLVKDSNGNHVIQKSFRCVNTFIQDFLFNKLNGEIFGLCLDLYGCRVIQCILVKGTVHHRFTIFNEIYKDPMRLIQDRYGNYVIQHALQYCATADTNRLIEKIVNNIILLSQQKYASNVVEKCLNHASKQMQAYAMIVLNSRDSQIVKRLCLDVYANYVVQKLLEKVDVDQVQAFSERIQPFFPQMRRHVCGRKIIDLLGNRLQNAQP